MSEQDTQIPPDVQDPGDGPRPAVTGMPETIAIASVGMTASATMADLPVDGNLAWAPVASRSSRVATADRSASEGLPRIGRWLNQRTAGVPHYVFAVALVIAVALAALLVSAGAMPGNGRNTGCVADANEMYPGVGSPVSGVHDAWLDYVDGCTEFVDRVSG